MFYGTLLEKSINTPNEWSRYLRVVICVETGFGLNTVRTNVFDKTDIAKVEAIPIRAQVQFSGNMIKLSHAQFFKLHTIDAVSFDRCEKCLAPLEDPCPGCLKDPTERVYGEWLLRASESINGSYKLTFTQDDNTLCRYIFAHTPFHLEAGKLKENDTVKLEGWRDVKRHVVLSTMQKL